MLYVKFKKLHPDAQIPLYKTSGSAGADVHSVEHATLKPGEMACVDLGFSVAIPEGYEIQVRPRSGLALKDQITVLNTPGTIDADYRGPVKVILINLGAKVFNVKAGDRIAQIVLNRVPQARFLEVEDLDETLRGSGGFGSTGV